MSRRGQPELPAGVKQLGERIERWRRTRERRTAMPADLWSGAVALARSEGAYATARALRLNIFMSLIHTVELNGENPFEYLVALQRHRHEVALDPDEWMPWNYRDTLAALSSETLAPP